MGINSDRTSAVTVLLFASAQDAADDQSSVTLPYTVDVVTLGELAKVLVGCFPKLRRVLETCSWAINEEMVDDDDVGGVGVLNRRLEGGDIVAVLPPVSGG